METYGEFKLGKFQVMDPLSTFDSGALRDSINEKGVIDPVTVDEDGYVIDGHNRVAFAAEAGIPSEDIPRAVLRGLPDEEKTTMARALNLARRHLGIRSKRKAWQEYVEAIEITLRAAPESSDREISRRFGVHNETVGAVRKRLEEAEAIGEVVRPHTNTLSATDGFRHPEPPTPNHANHRSEVQLRMVFDYPCPSDEDRKRVMFPFPQQADWPRWELEVTLQSRAPRSLQEAAAFCDEVRDRLWREIQRKPFETMKLKEPASLSELSGARQ